MVALERLAELDLGRRLPLGREPSPGGIELVEGVPDDLAPFRRGSLTHGSNVTRPQRPCLTHVLTRQGDHVAMKPRLRLHFAIGLTGWTLLACADTTGPASLGALRAIPTGR